MVAALNAEYLCATCDIIVFILCSLDGNKVVCFTEEVVLFLTIHTPLVLFYSMMTILLRGSTKILQGGASYAFAKQQMRRISQYQRSGSSSISMGAALTLGGLASSLVGGATVTTLCEGKDDKSFLQQITKKDKDGSTNWAETVSQVTGSDFWDKVATATGEKVQHAYDTGIPSQLSYGFVCGYCSGYALKTVGRGAAVVFGLGFMSLQTMAYYGYIKIDHDRLEDDFKRAFDLNKDGQVNKDDADIAYNKVMEVLQYSLPAGGGFGTGFVAGVRSG